MHNCHLVARLEMSSANGCSAQRLRGDLAGVCGDLAGVCGDLAGLRGDLAGVRGDIVGASGAANDDE